MYYTSKAFQTIIITNFSTDCMNIRNLFKKDHKVHNGLQIKSFPNAHGSALHDFLTGSFLDGFVTPTRAMDFYRSSASLAHAVDLIAKEIEKIKPVLEHPDGTLDPNAVILKLLRNPQPLLQLSFRRYAPLQAPH